jgi:TetR/AcrR family hemagglutinin/protease transcriptional regulator
MYARLTGLPHGGKRLPPDIRKYQILRCAVRAFAIKGITRAVHADVARLAGVSIPTIFNYFPSREDLVTAVLNEVSTYFVELSAKTYHEHENSTEALRAQAHAFASAAVDMPDHVAVWLEWSISIGRETWYDFLDFQRTLLNHASRAIARDQERGTIAADVIPEEIAYLMLGFSNSIVIRIHTPGQDIEKVHAFIDSTMARLSILLKTPASTPA